ncbi:hypothetical protein [Achromobacter marplatensis]|uniref:hypothetical protein n=1 Tax=Achromobacter marplatensis TaxID=470868 RepID=UPI0039F70E51
MSNGISTFNAARIFFTHQAAKTASAQTGKLGARTFVQTESPTARIAQKLAAIGIGLKALVFMISASPSQRAAVRAKAEELRTQHRSAGAGAAPPNAQQSPTIPKPLPPTPTEQAHAQPPGHGSAIPKPLPPTPMEQARPQPPENASVAPKPLPPTPTEQAGPQLQANASAAPKPLPRTPKEYARPQPQENASPIAEPLPRTSKAHEQSQPQAAKTASAIPTPPPPPPKGWVSKIATTHAEPPPMAVQAKPRQAQPAVNADLAQAINQRRVHIKEDDDQADTAWETDDEFGPEPEPKPAIVQARSSGPVVGRASGYSAGGLVFNMKMADRDAGDSKTEDATSSEWT